MIARHVLGVLLLLLFACVVSGPVARAENVESAVLADLTSVALAAGRSEGAEAARSLLAFAAREVRAMDLDVRDAAPADSSDEPVVLLVSVHPVAGDSASCIVALALEEPVVLARGSRAGVLGVTWQRVRACDTTAGSQVLGARAALQVLLDEFANDLAAASALRPVEAAAPAPAPAPAPVPATAPSPLESVRAVFIGDFGSGRDADRFREELADELQRAGLKLAQDAASADGALSGSVIVETVVHGSSSWDSGGGFGNAPRTMKASATVKLVGRDGAELWAGTFEPAMMENPLRSPIKSRAREAARALALACRISSP